MNTQAAPVEVESRPLTDQELTLMHAYWRACNYLAVAYAAIELEGVHDITRIPEHPDSRRG